MASRYAPSAPERPSLSLSSCIASSSLEAAEMKSSSESIVMEVVVTGVGGAASGPAEASLLGSGVLDMVASAAFRFLVVGGIVRHVGGCSSG